MPSKLHIRHLSSRKTRKYVRKLLDELGIDNEFSVVLNNKIYKSGKQKQVTVKNCDGSIDKKEVEKKLEEELGLTDVTFEK